MPARRSALVAAAERGHLEAVAAALDEGLPVDARSVFQSTLLHAAAGRGQWEVVELLLERGADVSAIDFGRMRRTALHLACHGGHIRTVEILRSRGADVHAQGRGWSKLVQGVRCGSFIDHTEPCSESPDALAKNETVRLALNETPWSPDIHARFPRQFRDAVRAVLLCARRAPPEGSGGGGSEEGSSARGRARVSDLPHELILLVAERMAYPISAWVDRAAYRDASGD